MQQCLTRLWQFISLSGPRMLLQCFIQLCFILATYAEICRKPTEGWLVILESTVLVWLSNNKCICTKTN